MGKRNKRRRKSKSLTPGKPNTPPAVNVQTLPIPNHNVSTDLSTDSKTELFNAVFPPDVCSAFDPKLNPFKDNDAGLYDKAFWTAYCDVKRRFPLLSLRVMDSNNQPTMAFSDPSYQAASVPRAGIAPPTWFDPEVFVRMALEDAELQRLLKSSAESQSLKALPQINARLQHVLDNKYLPYLMAMFDRVSDVIGRWLIAREAVLAADKQTVNKPNSPVKST